MKKILGVEVIESINDILHGEESEAFYNYQSEKSNDFVNEPERAARCYDAAAEGCDGSYHWEVIEDFREFGSDMLREAWKKIDDVISDMDVFDFTVHKAKQIEAAFEQCETDFEDSVVRCEKWHIEHGTYEQQVG